MADNEDNVNEGFTIQVKAGDIVDTGSGPATAVAIATAMWVPKGSVLNGRLVTKSDEQI